MYKVVHPLPFQSSFLSIEMEAGRLAIKHDLGEGVGILVSQTKINTGEWHAVSINRVRQMSKWMCSRSSIVAGQTSSDQT